ncbi:MAG: tRNA 2-thiouridine(34) synthase MnmA [Crocinitomicaceae bacterium]|nr:tRNA 2-thiouridine(34) synthase MnmA [Crocinitomicaceae bacterium]|tara:strand:- start:598 stop:1779 length:1182 start_codon:yes stop_codon:yes gene_type:complete
MKRVVIGLSGGVDSSVAAYLLKEQGYEVIAMFMRNWHDESVTISNECPWIDDSNDALLVAQDLGIPFQVIDLSEAYKNRIVDYMFNEYERGRTPNPDVLCNREIKFDLFLKAALELGADYVATGHYCRKKTNENGSYSLLAGVDKTKDQSYFLCQISQEQLSKALFPVGELKKSEVREIAKKMNLVTAEKKDSQGLCFIGKVSLPIFLQQKLKQKKGDIIEIPESLSDIQSYHQNKSNLNNLEALSSPFRFKRGDGSVVAHHQGAHFYTIGQRKGLHVGGRPKASFAIGIDVENNIVFTGQGEKHLGLYRKALKIEKGTINYLDDSFNDSVKDFERKFLVRIRYRQKLQEATLICKDGNHYIVFEENQRGITSGQFAAWYSDEVLIGSGVIES